MHSPFRSLNQSNRSSSQFRFLTPLLDCRISRFFMVPLAAAPALVLLSRTKNTLEENGMMPWWKRKTKTFIFKWCLHRTTATTWVGALLSGSAPSYSRPPVFLGPCQAQIRSLPWEIEVAWRFFFHKSAAILLTKASTEHSFFFFL